MQVVIIYIFIIIFFALFHKVDAYKAFCEGVEKSIPSVIKIFPSLLSIIFVINVFIHSGVIELFETYFSSFMVSAKVIMQIFFKPISWSSSLMMMMKIYEIEGVDSTNSILSTIIQGSFDTTIYVATMYFASVKIERPKYTYIVGLLGNFLTFCFIFTIYYIFF